MKSNDAEQAITLIEECRDGLRKLDQANEIVAEFMDEIENDLWQVAANLADGPLKDRVKGLVDPRAAARYEEIEKSVSA